MDNKFELCTIVEKNLNTFSEFESVEHALEDFGEKYKKEILGYFPPKTNVTFSELEKIEEDLTSAVAYHKGDETGTYHILKNFNSTLELKGHIEEIVNESFRGKDYVCIYKNKDFVYVQ